MDDHRIELDGFVEQVDNHLMDMDSHLAEMDDIESSIPANPEVFYMALRGALDRLNAYGEPINPQPIVH